MFHYNQVLVSVTRWMKNQRERSAGREATRGHGETEPQHSLRKKGSNSTFNKRKHRGEKFCSCPNTYGPDCCVVLQGGAEGGRVWLTQSHCGGAPVPVQEEKVCVRVYVRVLCHENSPNRPSHYIHFCFFLSCTVHFLP